MAFTYGFYDALDYDRRYAAKDFGDLISMLVTDGVMENYGQKFFTTVGTGMDVNVGTGKAWFDNTWSTNDSIMVVTLPQSDITRPRYDAIVLEVNEEIAVRANSIKVISGAPQVTPTKPTLTNTETVHQHPLAYILVPAAATAITASDIEIVVGRSDCPFATSILQKTDITDLYNKWENDFQTWFNNLKDQLTSNVVTNLQGQINTLVERVDANWKNTLSSATKVALGLSESSTPNDAFEALRKKTDRYVLFTSNGTFRPSAYGATGANGYVLVHGCAVGGGGGGGGGGASRSTLSTSAGGGGGACGAVVFFTFLLATTSSISITIGSGGAGGRGGNHDTGTYYSGVSGNRGGNTSVGAYVTANGGYGGSGANTSNNIGGSAALNGPGSSKADYVAVQGVLAIAPTDGKNTSYYGEGGMYGYYPSLSYGHGGSGGTGRYGSPFPNDSTMVAGGDGATGMSGCVLLCW